MAVVVTTLAVAALCTLAFIVMRSNRGGSAANTRAVEARSAGAAQPVRSAAKMLSEESLTSLFTDTKRVSEERARYSAALAAGHRVEAVDATWSPQAQRALAELAADAGLVETGLAPQAFDSECRTRTCRVSATFADYNAAQDWANFFLTGSGGTFAQAELFVDRDTNGKTNVLIFGVRR